MNCSHNQKPIVLLFSLILYFFALPIYGQWTGYRYDDTTHTDSLGVIDSSSNQVDSAAVHDSLPSTSIQRDTIYYEADIIEYDRVEKIILLRNNAVIRYEDMELYADTIHYLIEKNSIIATGYPQWVQGGDTAVGEYMVYNLQSKRGRVKYTTAHLDNAKYDGQRLSISEEKHFYMEDGDYTSCAVVDSPHYCFYGKHIKVVPNDKIYCRPVVLNIGGAPVTALPYWIIPIEKGRRSGWLTPRFGGNPTRGGYVDNVGYYWAPNDYADFSLSGNVNEFSSAVVNAATNYALRYWLRGNLSGKYSLSSDQDVINKLWALNYSHDQNILPDESMKLSGRGDIVSQENFYKSLSEDTTELLNQRVSANMSLTKSFSKINGNSSLTWNRDHNFNTNKVNQDLPSFNFTLGSRPLIPYKPENTNLVDNNDEEERWYNKLNYSYSLRINRKISYKKLTNQRDSVFDFAGLTHSIPMAAPFKIFKWFNLSPNFNVSQSFFSAYIGSTPKPLANEVMVTDTVSSDSIVLSTIVDTLIKGNDTLFVCSTGVVIDTAYYYDTTRFHWSKSNFEKFQTYSWNTGVSLSTELYGIFPINLFSLTGIRHTLTPLISYTFTPEKKISRSFPQVGISYSGKTDRKQVVALSFRNLFQGRATGEKSSTSDQPVEKKFTIVSGSIGMSYDFEARSRKLSSITSSANIPSKIVNFSYNSTFTPYNDVNKLIVPKLLGYSISLRPHISGAKGSFWGGDLLLFEGIEPEQYMEGYDIEKKPTWSINFSPSYSFKRSRETLSEKFKTSKNYHLSTSANIQFTNIWSSSWSSSFDFTQNKFMNHSLNFYCNLECFELKFNWYPSGFNQGAFNFQIKIKEHPEIKWDHPRNN